MKKAKNLNEVAELLEIEPSALERKRSSLFPTSGQPEQILRNIFLSCLTAVKPLRENLLRSISGSITNKSATLHSFDEVKTSEKDRPDSLIVITTGKGNPVISWGALIETKLKQDLCPEQLKRYAKTAKEWGCDLITISNDLSSKITKLGSCNYHHWSWVYIERVILGILEERESHDPEQVYILEELLKYMDSDKVDVSHFNSMGKFWKEDAKVINEDHLKIKNEHIERVSSLWVQEERDICLQVYKSSLRNKDSKDNKLSCSIKIDTKPSKNRSDEIIENLKNKRELESTFVCLNTKLRTLLNIDFRSTRATIKVAVEPEKEKKAIGQITSLLKQLDKSGLEDQIKIGVKYGKSKEVYCSLKQLQNERDGKFKTYNTDVIKRTESISKITIRLSLDFNKAEFYNPKKFIEIIENMVIEFYEQVIVTI
ncbi:MAG: hypothetical protein HON23_07325 [Rickettsiales bacterium]|jgi:hypothetical protein|nr:hypothetical protein [Rickettsiales bacterium]